MEELEGFESVMWCHMIDPSDQFKNSRVSIVSMCHVLLQSQGDHQNYNEGLFKDNLIY